MYQIILSVLWRALPFILVAAVLGYGAYWFDNRGYERCRLEHDAAQLKIKIAADKRIKDEAEKARQNREAAERHLIGVLENETKRNEKLQRDIADISSQRMFVETKVSGTCSNQARLPDDQSAGASNAQARAELSEEAEKRFTRRGIEIEREMNKLTTLIEILEANQGACLEIVGNGR
ncbi:MAG: hypothetical protein H6937_02365 [Burkholderiales bacterium]|nr:hypothetical protein [Burkholderiales bacterium]